MTIQIAKILFFCFLSFARLYAQPVPRCATKQNDPELLEKYRVISEKIKEYQVLNSNRNSRVNDEILKIPVVVHIIHNNSNGRIGGDGNPNITDEQIFSQIKVINEDYRRKVNTLGFNIDPVGADMEIEFFLAQTDPSGEPSTGITRSYFNKNQYDVFNDLELISSISYWDSNRYLNIWVLDLASSYLGYSEFPTADFDGLELEDSNEFTDGIFIDYEAFGKKTGVAFNSPYDYGRTVTHEIGHWLGLIHTWGDAFCGDDYCNDTPPTERENLTNFCKPIFSRCNGTRTRNMIENYMDYSPDSCMNIFTQDQKGRVRAILDLSKRRRRLINYSKFLLPYASKLDVKILNNPNTPQNLKIQVLLPDFKDFSIKIYDLLGREIIYQEYKDYPGTIISIADMSIPPGLYILRVNENENYVTQRMMVL